LLPHRPCSRPETEAVFLDDVGIGETPYQLSDLTDTDLRRMSQLVRRYADRLLGATDSSIVAARERLDADTAATLNRHDFDNLRPRRRPAPAIALPDNPDRLGRPPVTSSRRRRCDRFANSATVPRGVTIAPGAARPRYWPGHVRRRLGADTAFRVGTSALVGGSVSCQGS
jgi:hypothetical protein